MVGAEARRHGRLAKDRVVQGGPGGPDTKKRVGREQEGGWRPVEGMLEGRGGEVEAGAYGGHIAGGRGVTLHLDSWIRSSVATICRGSDLAKMRVLCGYTFALNAGNMRVRNMKNAGI